MSRIYNQLIKEEASEGTEPDISPALERPRLTLVPPPPIVTPLPFKNRRAIAPKIGLMIAVFLLGTTLIYLRQHAHKHAIAAARLQNLDTSPPVMQSNQILLERKAAMSFFDKQDYASAKTRLEKLSHEAPPSVEIFNDLAMTYFKLGDFPNAEKTWKKAMQINPDDASTLNNFASFMIAQKEWENAVFLLTKALAVQPDLLEARLNLAIAFESSGRPLQAIPEYEIYLASPHSLPNLREILKKRVARIQSFSLYYEKFDQTKAEFESD